MTGIVPTLFGFPGTLAHGARQVQSWGRSTAGTQPDIGSPGRQTGTGRLPCILSRAASCTTSTSMKPTGWIHSTMAGFGMGGGSEYSVRYVRRTTTTRRSRSAPRMRRISFRKRACVWRSLPSYRKMTRHQIPSGRVFGISFGLDYSWFLIFVLLTWSLAVSYYPAAFPGWPASLYWILGAVSAIMLFVSVLLHELGHSVVALQGGKEGSQ